MPKCRFPGSRNPLWYCPLLHQVQLARPLRSDPCHTLESHSWPPRPHDCPSHFVPFSCKFLFFKSVSSTRFNTLWDHVNPRNRRCSKVDEQTNLCLSIPRPNVIVRLCSWCKRHFGQCKKGREGERWVFSQDSHCIILVIYDYKEVTPALHVLPLVSVGQEFGQGISFSHMISRPSTKH